MKIIKRISFTAVASILATATLTGCGDNFLDSKIYNGIDLETGLTSTDNIGNALNGTYYRLMQYYFGGNYATMIGDIASDVAYWNGKTGHFSNLYQFAPTETDTYLGYIWEYGYKVADNSARVIKAASAIYESQSDGDKASLDEFMAEAYALRAYAHFQLVNVFAHQIKVNGTDFSNNPGIVVVNEPIPSGTQVSRSTIGEVYASIESDLKKSLEHFAKADWEKDGILYFTPKAVQGLLSRVYLFEEKYSESIVAANEALSLAGIDELVNSDAGYKALYNGGESNTESFFCLAINRTDNWSANSCGTLWTTYSYSPSPWLQSIMAEDDVRRSVWGWTEESTPEVPWFNGGKFGAFGMGGNTAYGTNYLINAPEMFLNIAEANLKLNKVTEAQESLFAVARRNPAIEKVSDLPSDSGALLSFIRDERARELFQEGFRLFDLRRWGMQANLYAVEAPTVKWMINDFNVSDIIFPIPADEINAGFGVEQNKNWNDAFPAM